MHQHLSSAKILREKSRHARPVLEWFVEFEFARTERLEQLVALLHDARAGLLVPSDLICKYLDGGALGWDYKCKDQSLTRVTRQVSNTHLRWVVRVQIRMRAQCPRCWCTRRWILRASLCHHRRGPCRALIVPQCRSDWWPGGGTTSCAALVLVLAGHGDWIERGWVLPNKAIITYLSHVNKKSNSSLISLFSK